MLRIMNDLQSYVPSYFDENRQKKFLEQGIVGDQLTVERGVNGLLEVWNWFNPEKDTRDFILK